MDGHDRGVNWCDFHPELNLIISGADDRKVKIWKYSGKYTNLMILHMIIIYFLEVKAWEHDSLYGHNANVSCAIFHPKLDCIISNSEDKTTRVWSLDKRSEIDKFKKESDRFWILAVIYLKIFYFFKGTSRIINFRNWLR